MTQAARFKQEDITRAFRGAKKAGFARVRVAIDTAGNMVVDASDEPADVATLRRNPLDRLLEGR